VADVHANVNAGIFSCDFATTYADNNNNNNSSSSSSSGNYHYNNSNIIMFVYTRSAMLCMHYNVNKWVVNDKQCLSLSYMYSGALMGPKAARAAAKVKN
jgi:hypothetical protein